MLALDAFPTASCKIHSTVKLSQCMMIWSYVHGLWVNLHPSKTSSFAMNHTFIMIMVITFSLYWNECREVMGNVVCGVVHFHYILQTGVSIILSTSYYINPHQHSHNHPCAFHLKPHYRSVPEGISPSMTEGGTPAVWRIAEQREWWIPIKPWNNKAASRPHFSGSFAEKTRRFSCSQTAPLRPPARRETQVNARLWGVEID